MNLDWLDILSSDRHEFSVPELTVSSEEFGEFAGNGHVSWNAEKGIRIRAVTAGGQKLAQLSSYPIANLGELIPRATYVAFSGSTQDGWMATTDKSHRDGYSTNSVRPEVSWDLTTTGVTLKRSSGLPSEEKLRILLGPQLPIWPRKTETTVNNKYFGHSTTEFDWLTTLCSFGRVSARKRSGNWFEVCVQPLDGQSLPKANDLYRAVAQAFSFFLGRRCVSRGFEDTRRHSDTRRLETRALHTTRNCFLGPIGSQLEAMSSVESLLGLTIDFFLSELGVRVAQFLHLCWDTLDNAHSTRITVDSICVEGLMGVASEILGPTQPRVAQDDLAKFKQLLQHGPQNFSHDFSKRLEGLMGMFRNLSPSDIFRDWIERGVLSVTKDDVKAWKDLRNRSAHGRLTPVEETGALQARVSQHDRIQNLINKIALQLIGYSGIYIDYSKPGYPAGDFPCVSY